MAAFAVVGATSWGVTLAWLLSLNHDRVVLLVRDEAEAARVRERRGLARLPEVTLPAHVAVVAGPPPASELAGVVLAVPAEFMRTSVDRIAAWRTLPVLSAAKGLERPNGLRMSEVIASHWSPEQLAALSGPNLAHEIGRGLPAAAVVGAQSEPTARLWQQALATPFFRLYTSADLPGIELAGALKNVIAISAGAANGLHLGSNAVSALVTRGLAEITRLGVALGADPLTFQGLAGVGDLTATCFSPLSRNHRLGELLAQGKTPAAALAMIGEAVEGAGTAPVALRLGGRAGVELPIAAAVTAVLDGSADVKSAMAALLTRPLRSESSLR